MLRHKAHEINTPQVWEAFRKVRCLLKEKIKAAKQHFINKALSSSKPKEVWRIIHRILHPSLQPLRLDVNSLNRYFTNTAQRTLGSTNVDARDDLFSFINNLHQSVPEEEAFKLRLVTPSEVAREINRIRNDTSTGPDQIPIKFIKPVTDIIAGPLTHIINAFIKISSFPEAWKIAKITPIPKNDSIASESDMRPISILPVLSKVFERLVHQQVFSFIDSHNLLKDNISGFRKGHSTTTVLLRIKDDIIKAMKREEITLMVLADFSKAFDTIKYKTVLKKLDYLGFLKSFLNWTIEFLTDRRHFVQIDDKTSDRSRVNFGVPQGSIMGPLIFNLYVADLHAHINMQCHQYTDDTTLYVHCKPSSLESCKRDLNKNLCNLEEWSRNANLVIIHQKPK